MTKPTNPLDNLQQFNSLDLPSPPRQHTSGRRELRSSILSRGVNIMARARTVAEKTAALVKGEMFATLPVKRKEPKRGGMTKKAWKKARRAVRESQ